MAATSGRTLPERTTRYSLWSRGRLLGHTTLDFYPFPQFRMGWLELTELGERFVDTMDKLEFELRDARGCVIATRQVAVQDTDGFAALDFDDDDVADSDVDVDSPVDEFEAGLIELGLSEPPVWDDAGEFDSIECLVEPDLPRFQVFVELECADSVPVADRWKDDPDVQQMLHDRRRDRDESSA